MASVACAVKKATSGGGARNTVTEIFVRDTVSGAHKKIATVNIDVAAYDGLSGAEQTEFNDSANTLSAIRGVSAYGTVTDL